MSTSQTPVLSLESDADSFRIQCLQPGPVPTVHINAGQNITVEIDIARPHAPVSVTVHDRAAAAASLCDLLGTAAAQELLRSATFTGFQNRQTPQEPLGFEPGPAWPGLVAAAYQHWILYWNPLPLDQSLAALDSIAAAHENRAFGGATTAREHVPAALHAASTLRRLLNAGQITENAAGTVRAALNAVQHNLMPDNPVHDAPYTLPLALSEPELTALLTTPTADPGRGPGLLLTGSPDWRLTGHGPASTAENSIRITTHHRNPDAITITIPAQRTNGTGPVPGYQALITEPGTGALLAYTTLKAVPGGLLCGHAFPRRPLQPTDHADIRHPALHGRPEPDPKQRSIDRTHREAARRHILQRLTHPNPAGLLPSTLMELAQTGGLVTAMTEGTIGSLDLFLFTLLGEERLDVVHRGSGQKTQIEYAEYRSKDISGTIKITAINQTMIEVALEDFSKLGRAQLLISISTPSGQQSIETTPQTINRRGATFDVVLPVPDAIVSAIRVRYLSPEVD